MDFSFFFMTEENILTSDLLFKYVDELSLELSKNTRINVFLSSFCQAIQKYFINEDQDLIEPFVRSIKSILNMFYDVSDSFWINNYSIIEYFFLHYHEPEKFLTDSQFMKVLFAFSSSKNCFFSRPFFNFFCRSKYQDNNDMIRMCELVLNANDDFFFNCYKDFNQSISGKILEGLVPIVSHYLLRKNDIPLASWGCINNILSRVANPESYFLFINCFHHTKYIIELFRYVISFPNSVFYLEESCCQITYLLSNKIHNNYSLLLTQFILLSIQENPNFDSIVDLNLHNRFFPFIDPLNIKDFQYILDLLTEYEKWLMYHSVTVSEESIQHKLLDRLLSYYSNKWRNPWIILVTAGIFNQCVYFPFIDNMTFENSLIMILSSLYRQVYIRCQKGNETEIFKSITKPYEGDFLHVKEFKKGNKPKFIYVWKSDLNQLDLLNQTGFRMLACITKKENSYEAYIIQNGSFYSLKSEENKLVEQNDILLSIYSLKNDNIFLPKRSLVFSETMLGYIRELNRAEVFSPFFNVLKKFSRNYYNSFDENAKLFEFILKIIINPSLVEDLKILNIENYKIIKDFIESHQLMEIISFESKLF